VADLVSLSELKTFLRVSGTTDDALLETLLDQIEDLFERACGRSHAPFQGAQTGRVEWHDGTARTLWLDYPVQSLTAITLGHDASAPVETLAVSDPAIVRWEVGSRRVERVDGATFGAPGVRRFVRVTYDAQADLPASAALAVKRATATVYRQIGSEDARSEQLPDFSHVLAEAAADPAWQLAVAAHRRPLWG